MVCKIGTQQNYQILIIFTIWVAKSIACTRKSVLNLLHHFLSLKINMKKSSWINLSPLHNWITQERVSPNYLSLFLRSRFLHCLISVIRIYDVGCLGYNCNLSAILHCVITSWETAAVIFRGLTAMCSKLSLLLLKKYKKHAEDVIAMPPTLRWQWKVSLLLRIFEMFTEASSGLVITKTEMKQTQC